MKDFEVDKLIDDIIAGIEKQAGTVIDFVEVGDKIVDDKMQLKAFFVDGREIDLLVHAYSTPAGMAVRCFGNFDK